MTALNLSQRALIQLIARVCLRFSLQLSKAILLSFADDISKVLTTGQGKIQFDLRDSEGKTYGKVHIKIQAGGRF